MRSLLLCMLTAFFAMSLAGCVIEHEGYGHGHYYHGYSHRHEGYHHWHDRD